MKKVLILTEKPSVARDFAKALNLKTAGKGLFENDKYVITWAIGHLLIPLDPGDYHQKWKRWSLATLPIIPDIFCYKPASSSKQQLDIVLKQIKRIDVGEIIVATDAGREGELIARTIIQKSKVKKKCWRFWTGQALTSSVIKEELGKLGSLRDYDRLYKAGCARQMADWLVGMNLSRMATIRMGDLFSVGRVQTAVLSMLVERKQQIDNFVSIPYWKVKGTFQFNSDLVEGYWFDPNKKREANWIFSKDLAQTVTERVIDQAANVNSCKHVNKSAPSPQLFSLTELQRIANRMYGFSAKKTLNIAQKLYEKYKCLSYPRTDSRVLGNKNLSLVRKLLDKFRESHPNYFEYYDPSKVSLKNRLVFNDAKLTDHHALVPLRNYKGNNKSEEGKIFDLVLRRFLMAFSRNYLTTESTLIIDVSGDYFKTSGIKIIDLGHRFLGYADKEKYLPDLKIGDEGITIDTKIEENKTTPPAEYTDGSLLQDMINPSKMVKEEKYKKIFRGDVGLGTQATRAQIIETLINRKYIERDKKTLRALPKGVTLIKCLRKMNVSKVLTLPSETASWELQLESIAQGNESETLFIEKIKEFVIKCDDEWKTEDVEKVEKSQNDIKKTKSQNQSIAKCPLCKASIIENSKAYACERWKEGCKMTIWKKIAGKSISKSQVVKLINKGNTDLLKGWKSKKGTKFNARLALTSQGTIEFKFSRHKD